MDERTLFLRLNEITYFIILFVFVFGEWRRALQ